MVLIALKLSSYFFKIPKLREKGITVVHTPQNVIKIKFIVKHRNEKGETNKLTARGKTLGWYYDEPQIKKRIEQCYLLRTGEKLTHKHSRLIDTSHERFQQSKGLERWAEIRNMQEASKLLNILTEYNLNNQEELENKSIERYGNRVEIVGKLNGLQRRINDIGDTVKTIKKYMKYRPYDDEYKKAAFKKKYAKEHEKELRYYDGARKELLEKFPDKRLPKIENLLTQTSHTPTPDNHR